VHIGYAARCISGPWWALPFKCPGAHLHLSMAFAVMSILASAAVGKGAKGIEQTFADAAAARRLLKDVEAMRSRFKETDDKLSKIATTCKKVQIA
jgi:hypothetical protein